jgi:hypothetical protein
LLKKREADIKSELLDKKCAELLEEANEDGKKKQAGKSETNLERISYDMLMAAIDLNQV